MTRHTKLLMLVLLTLLTSFATSACHTATADTMPTESRVDALRQADNQRRHSLPLMLDAQTAHRVACSRPSRTVMPHGNGNGRGQNRTAPVSRHMPLRLLACFHGVRHNASLPLRTIASCDYYVIALRHIIR